MRVALGIDLHKKTAVCFAVYAGDGGPTESEQVFLDTFNRRYRTQRSEPEDIAEIADALKRHEVHVLIENSTKTFDVYWILTNLGCNVVVAQSRDLYRITKSVKKNDLNDSKELAAYMRRRLHGEREFAECVMPSREWMMRREVCRTLFYEKSHLADLKRRVRSHMLLHGIRLSREYGDIFNQRSMAELEATGDVCLRIMVNEARTIKKRTNLEARTIELMFGNLEIYRLIYSIPGFGKVSAAYMAAMIMDIGRFDTSNQFTASFGIVPKQRDSADSHPNCGTTHRGDDHARRLIKQAAFVHVQHVEDSVVTRMYNRLKARGMAHNEVLVACGRKLMTVVWSVLTNRLPYASDAGLLARAEATEAAIEDDMAYAAEEVVQEP